MTIKQKIIKELENTKIPDLKFLFSEEVLDISLEILQDLLKDEKERFDKLISEKYEGLDAISVIPAKAGISSKEKQLKNTKDTKILKSNYEKDVSKHSGELIDSWSSQE